MAATATKKKAAKPALHPPYVDMAVSAIADLKERKASSKTVVLQPLVNVDWSEEFIFHKQETT